MPDPTDFQDSDDTYATQTAMHDDVVDQLEAGDITEEEAEAQHEEIDACVANMDASAPERDD